MLNLLCFVVIFCAFPFPAPQYPPHSLPNSSPTCPLSLISFWPFPSRKRWTRNLAITDRMCSAWNTNTITTANIYCIYPYASRDWPDVLDLSLRPLVCPIIRLLPTCERYTSKNEWTDFNANWHKSSPMARARLVDPGGQEVKGQSHRRQKLFGSLVEISFSIPWVDYVEA